MAETLDIFDTHPQPARHSFATAISTRLLGLFNKRPTSHGSTPASSAAPSSSATDSPSRPRLAHKATAQQALVVATIDAQDLREKLLHAVSDVKAKAQQDEPGRRRF